MHEYTRTANLLGAAALAVNDVLLTGVTAVSGTSASGAAALVALGATPGLSVTELGRRVGLSQPAAARMVDSLERDGLVERRPTVGRWVAVHPTHAGQAAAEELLHWRGGKLATLVGRLSDDDRSRLDEILGKLLTAAYGEAGNAQHMCRLCDRDACVDNGGTCPVGQADRERRTSQDTG